MNSQELRVKLKELDSHLKKLVKLIGDSELKELSNRIEKAKKEHGEPSRKQ